MVIESCFNCGFGKTNVRFGSPSFVVTAAWYTIESAKHFFCIGHSSVLLQLHKAFSVATLSVDSLFLLCPSIMCLTFVMQL